MKLDYIPIAKADISKGAITLVGMDFWIKLNSLLMDQEDLSLNFSSKILLLSTTFNKDEGELIEAFDVLSAVGLIDSEQWSNGLIWIPSLYDGLCKCYQRFKRNFPTKEGEVLEKTTKSVRPTFTWAYNFCQRSLYPRIKSKNSKAPNKCSYWAIDIERMITVDGYTKEEVEEMWEFVLDCDRKNNYPYSINSGRAFREKAYKISDRLANTKEKKNTYSGGLQIFRG